MRPTEWACWCMPPTSLQHCVCVCVCKWRLSRWGSFKLSAQAPTGLPQIGIAGAHILICRFCYAYCTPHLVAGQPSVQRFNRIRLQGEVDALRQPVGSDNKRSRHKWSTRSRLICPYRSIGSLLHMCMCVCWVMRRKFQ